MTVIEEDVHFGRGRRAQKLLRPGLTPFQRRVPRISKLMALALKFEGLLQTGTVRSCAELANLGHVSTTRISQIMNLLLLAPEIQERLLFLQPIQQGPDPVFLKDLQRSARQSSWKKQRKDCCWQ